MGRPDVTFPKQGYMRAVSKLNGTERSRGSIPYEIVVGHLSLKKT